MNGFELALWGAIGALCAEVLKGFEKWVKLPSSRFRQIVTSFKFFSLVFLVGAVGAVASLVVNAENGETTLAQAITAGISAFAVLRGFTGVAMAGGSGKGGGSLGPGENSPEAEQKEVAWSDVL